MKRISPKLRRPAGVRARSRNPERAAIPRVEGPRSRKKISPKLIGEWIELKFMARAADEGLTVSKPYGDSAPFDFIVGRHQPLHRVQVRGTSTLGNRSYICHLARGKIHYRFNWRNYDFVAVYVIPYDQWYVIPTKVIRHNHWAITLFPHVKNSKGKHEQYRDAWHLLRQGPKQKFLEAFARTNEKPAPQARRGF